MLTIFCLLLLINFAHCQEDDLPSRIDVERSINRTIEEVERQVHADPNLPRLSRQDIVKLLQNITTRDLNEHKDKNKLERARNLYQKALMVVLPYNAEESTGNLKDLYTKPPMTQIVPDHAKNSDTVDGNEDEKNLATNQVISKFNSKEPITMKSRYKNHRDTYSEVRTKAPLKETLKLESKPVKFSFNLENLQKNSYPTQETIASRYPVYKNKELEIVYSTSVTDQAVTKGPSKEITIELDKTKSDQNVLTSSQWRYNAPPSTTIKSTMPSNYDKIPFLPTINSDDRLVVSLPERLEMTTKDASVEEAFITSTEKPTALYVTPMSTETSLKAKYSSTYSLNSAGFRQAIGSTTTINPMRSEVVELLASIGLKPDNNSNVEDIYKKNKDRFESKFEPPSPSASSNSVSTSHESISKKPGSEIKKGVENLPPDVQLLFQRFGLETSLLDQPTMTTTQRPTVNLNSYTNFKPLPTSSVKDEDFKLFLAKFGLGLNEDRRAKSLRPSTEAPSMIEAVPDNMISILRNIGLISNSKKYLKTRPDIVEDMESTETSNVHVFKPHEVTVKDEEQRNKINELLDTVKLVKEGKADVQSVRKVANDLLETTKRLKDGPDPLKLEEIIKTYNEDLRNEVKRQQEQLETTTVAGNEKETTSSSTTITESSETTISTNETTDSSNDASDRSTTSSPKDLSTTTMSNLMALEESFGGTTKQPDPALPPKRKSGLYFLVDWNTFLEVGEDEKKKINLRFQPKVGDRTRFLPVTVP